MAETNPYPGSSSLSPEAREKVLQTFQHTLELARGGRNEEALLGCDFILKMDFRFAPARQLLDSLRGVSAGTVVDVAPFAAILPPAPAPKAPAPPSPPEPVELPPGLSLSSDSLPDAPPDLFAAPPAVTSSPFDDFAPEPPAAVPFAPVAAPKPAAPKPEAPKPATPAPAPAVPSALDSFGFDAFGSANPFDTGISQGVPPAAAPSAPSALSAGPAPLDHDPFGLPPVDPFATPPAIPALHGSKMPPAPPPVEAPRDDPFADFGGSEEATVAGFTGMAAPGSDSPFPMEEPAPPPSRPQAAPSAAPPAGVSAPAASGDPRVLQFLKQGDDAMARGQIQEAIDLWSRVFLIDLSNDDASRRIDAAREKQAQTAQAIDVLLSEGIQLFDSKDLLSARSKFLDVLALSESDPTARNYLNQIESALAQNESAAPPARGSGSDFLGDLSPSGAFPDDGGGGLFEQAPAPARPSESLLGPDSFAIPEDAEAEAPRRKTIKIDLRLVGAVVLAVAALAGGGIFLATRKKAPLPVPTPRPAAQKPVGEDLIAKAQGLFNQGKADEALQILVSIPDRDPRHREALALIDKFKSSAVPGPSPAAPSAASIDEMRLAGFAAMSANRYIEAVKALDPVVKARPDDTEAAQALSRAREHLAALASAVRSYNEQDYESAIKLLWDLRKKDMKNQDVEEFLFKSYFNQGIQDLQAGNSKKAAAAFQEAVALRPSDAEAARHLKFSKKYSQGATDILSRIYIKNASPRP